MLAGAVSEDALAHGAGRARHPHSARCAKASKPRSARSRKHAAGRARACKRHRRHASRKRHHRAKAKRSEHQGVKRQVLHAVVPPQQGAPAAASGAGGCEGAYVTPSEQNLALVSAATLCLINRERAAHGEQPLRANADLGHAAQGHSESMAAQAYFEHTSPDGRTPLGRMQASGYISGQQAAYEVGENIAWGSGQDATPAAIVAAWMASPPHRANILDGEFRDSGIGISPHLPASFAGGLAGAIYTQDFGAVL